MAEQMGMFGNEKPEYLEQRKLITQIRNEIHGYDIQIDGLKMSRDSALKQLYDVIITIPVSDRKEFTKHILKEEQKLMLETVEKHAAEAYIYGAKSKEGDNAH